MSVVGESLPSVTELELKFHVPAHVLDSLGAAAEAARCAQDPAAGALTSTRPAQTSPPAGSR